MAENIYPRFVEPHPSHIVHGIPIHFGAEKGPTDDVRFHRDRVTGKITVIVRDEAEERFALSDLNATKEANTNG
jgi:phosphopantothenoylcysteine synthetase/decarboxylase